MKQMLKTTLLSALVLLGAAKSNADQTNFVEGLNFRLFGLKQGGVTTNRCTIQTNLAVVKVGDQEIIGALGAGTSNSFSAAATLALVTSLADGSSTIQVRDCTNQVDVTAFFLHQQLGGPLFRGERNTKNGKTSSEELTFQRFALKDAAGFPALTVHFDVQGIVKDRSTRCDDFEHDGTRGHVTGLGDVNGSLLFMGGMIGIQGGTIEIIAGGSTGGTGGGGGDGGPGA